MFRHGDGITRRVCSLKGHYLALQQQPYVSQVGME